MELAARLRERSAEIEQAVLARVYSIADPADVDDPEYALGLREAAGAALDYAIAAIETGQAPIPVPERLRAQAGAAARNGVGLDTVLRRYFAGYALLGDFVVAESEDHRSRGQTIRPTLHALAAAYDQLVTTVSKEYARHAEGRLRSAAGHRAERVKMLLAGEPVDLEGLRYELDAWHLAAIAAGPGAADALRDLAAAVGRGILLVRPDEEAGIWAWLGGPKRLSAREALSLARRSLPPGVSLALGEPGQGVKGWRLSHRQAKAAMSVAQRGGEQCVWYADVALLASALRDEVLAASLRDTYLEPLERGRDRGASLVETLHAYFAAGRNASSAAVALGVSRQTVGIRLRTVEERIDRSLDGCAPELETALRLKDLGDRAVLPS